MSNYYEGHGDIIYPHAIDDRIKRLHDMKMDLDLNEDGEAELEVLIQFRTDVIDTCGGESAWEDSPGFIADSYFDEYVNSDVEGMHGSEVIQSLDRYLDWGLIKDDYMERFEEIDFDGVTYLIDNNRG